MTPVAKRVILTIGIVLVAVLEISFFPYHGPGGFLDLTLPLVIMIGDRRGLKVGLVGAFSLGFLLDIASPFVFGTYTAPLLVAAYLPDFLLRQMFTHHQAYTLPASAAASAVLARATSILWSIVFAVPFGTVTLPARELVSGELISGSLSAFFIVGVASLVLTRLSNLSGRFFIFPTPRFPR